LSRCSTLDVVYRSQQTVQAVVAERDPNGRPLLWLVVADLQLEPLEQSAQQRFGRRGQPLGREQGKQLQQVYLLLIGVRPLGDHRAQLGQFGLLLAVQFCKPPGDLLGQGPAGVVALLQRANQTPLAALEVGKGSLRPTGQAATRSSRSCMATNARLSPSVYVQGSPCRSTPLADPARRCVLVGSGPE
jgi:hypothetical protein